MIPLADCAVCMKHQDLNRGESAIAGIPIANRGGWFLSHFPVLDGKAATRGHLLIETKRHITDLTELNDEEAEAIGVLIRKGTAVLRGIGAEHVYCFRINDVTPHLHFHLVPRYQGTAKEFYGLQIMNNPSAPKVTVPEIAKLSRVLKFKI